jgi:hypothetical protein
MLGSGHLKQRCEQLSPALLGQSSSMCINKPGIFRKCGFENVTAFEMVESKRNDQKKATDARYRQKLAAWRHDNRMLYFIRGDKK